MNFPSEIEENILVKLTVKSIVRFMSVCKSWYSLFLDPHFINIHMKNSSNKLLLRLSTREDIVVMDSTSSIVHSHFFLNLEKQNDLYERAIIGSCNGIVCIHGIRRWPNVYGNVNEYFSLWNPALKITKNVMNRAGYRSLGVSEQVFVAFGFDNVCNDYMVLRFQKSLYTVQTQVEIYSLSSDSWRTVKVSPPHSIRGFFASACCTSSAEGVHVNGAHHWAVQLPTSYAAEYSSAITSFDMGEEVFKEMIIPSECTNTHMILFNYNESLTMLKFSSFLMDHMSCIWVMKDYGVPESWTKLCMIDVHQRVDRRVHFWELMHIKNEVIFSRYILPGAKINPLVFDLDKLEVKDTSSSITSIDVLKDVIEVATYKESLLLLHSTNLIHHQ